MMYQDKKTVLITGSSGLVSKQFASLLSNNYKLKFLTRSPKKANEYEWDVNANYIDIKAFENVGYIIHLAGAGVADRRWTKKRKKLIISSRIESLRLILKTLIENQLSIEALVSASAIGYYGSFNSETILEESSPNGNDFLASVCKPWEETAQQFPKYEVCKRVTILRFGLVLSNKGGALSKMLTPIKNNIVAALGKGNQYVPWIHIDDLCHIIDLSIKQPSIKGVFNAVAPEHSTNQEMTQTLAYIYKAKLRLPNIPSFLIKIIFGKASILLLKGSKVSCQKLLDNGFTFQYPKIKDALINLKNR